MPLVIAALGEAVGERSGLLNLGIEGMMLAGAFFGFATAYQTGSAVWGVLAGIVAGVVLGGLFAVLTVSLARRPGAGRSGHHDLRRRADRLPLSRHLWRTKPLAQRAHAARFAIPLLEPNPDSRRAPSSTSSFSSTSRSCCVPIFAFLLARTRFGLEVRAVGENPFAADAAGVNVTRTRYRRPDRGRHGWARWRVSFRCPTSRFSRSA